MSSWLNGIELDLVSVGLLRELQENSRSSYRELGRRVGLTAPAVAERVRRLEEAGVIRAFRSEVDYQRLGLDVVAFIRVRPRDMLGKKLVDWSQTRHEVLELHRVTGEESYLLKVAVAGMAELERMVDQLGAFGQTTTAVVLSSPIAFKRAVPPAERALAAESAFGRLGDRAASAR